MQGVAGLVIAKRRLKAYATGPEESSRPRDEAYRMLRAPQRLKPFSICVPFGTAEAGALTKTASAL